MFAVLISESIVFRMYDRTDDEVVRGRRGKRVLSSLHASVSDLGSEEQDKSAHSVAGRTSFLRNIIKFEMRLFLVSASSSP